MNLYWNSYNIYRGVESRNGQRDGAMPPLFLFSFSVFSFQYTSLYYLWRQFCETMKNICVCMDGETVKINHSQSSDEIPTTCISIKA